MHIKLGVSEDSSEHDDVSGTHMRMFQDAGWIGKHPGPSPLRNRVGGMSNSGEGGEDTLRYKPLQDLTR